MNKSNMHSGNINLLDNYIEMAKLNNERNQNLFLEDDD